MPKAKTMTDVYSEGAGRRGGAARKENQMKARTERRLNRETNWMAAELKRIAETKAEQALTEIGVAECPEASKFWAGLEEKSASYDDYQQQYEVSKKKAIRMKVKIESLAMQLDIYAAGYLKLEEENKGLQKRLHKLKASLEHEKDEKQRYIEALAEARRSINVLMMEGVNKPVGHATETAYLD